MRYILNQGRLYTVLEKVAYVDRPPKAVIRPVEPDAKGFHFTKIVDTSHLTPAE